MLAMGKGHRITSDRITLYSEDRPSARRSTRLYVRFKLQHYAMRNGLCGYRPTPIHGSGGGRSIQPY